MVDLPDTVTIQVTQKDIDAGVARKCHCCPIARAARRVFNGSTCLVDDDLRVVLNSHVYEYDLPSVAREFIATFDNDGEVVPFEFVASRYVGGIALSKSEVEEIEKDDLEAYGPRPCQRCGKALPDDWDFAWCAECGKSNCQHGNNPAECARCAMESDLAFDANRERGV